MDNKTPPSYFPNAVATSVGWVNPATGELLVSHRRLENAISLEGVPPRNYVFAINAALKAREVEAAATVEKVSDEQDNKEPVVDAVTDIQDIRETSTDVNPVKDEPKKKVVTKKTTKKKTAKKKAPAKKKTTKSQSPEA